MTVDQKKQKRPGLKLGLVIFTLILLAGAGIYLYAGWLGYQEAPKRVEVKDPSSSSYTGYSLSPDQESSLLSHGYPESFTILFYEEETSSQGMQTVRLETWDYYTQGIGLTFINGNLVSEDPIQWDSQDPVVSPPYTPDQFSAFMTLAEVIASAGLETYIEVPLNKELMDKGTLYYGESLSFGLQNDQLVYIEALAYIEE
jgi:hypothetical protein